MLLLINRGKLLIKDGPPIIRTMRGMRWNGNHSGYETSLTLDSLTNIRTTLGLTSRQIAPAVHPDLMRWAIAAKASADEAKAALDKVGRGEFEDFPWLDNSGEGKAPFHHQQVMASFAVNVDGVAFFCEMRTGKTRAWLEATARKIELGRHRLHADCLSGEGDERLGA
jgi:hypothetical protein